jgi:hypothetical protein
MQQDVKCAFARTGKRGRGRLFYPHPEKQRRPFDSWTNYGPGNGKPLKIDMKGATDRRYWMWFDSENVFIGSGNKAPNLSSFISLEQSCKNNFFIPSSMRINNFSNPQNYFSYFLHGEIAPVTFLT